LTQLLLRIIEHITPGTLGYDITQTEGIQFYLRYHLSAQYTGKENGINRDYGNNDQAYDQIQFETDLIYLL
jgi:hypothetical protein